jgi:hypothetical protein
MKRSNVEEKIASKADLINEASALLAKAIEMMDIIDFQLAAAHAAMALDVIKGRPRDEVGIPHAISVVKFKSVG